MKRKLLTAMVAIAMLTGTACNPAADDAADVDTVVSEIPTTAEEPSIPPSEPPPDGPTDPASEPPAGATDTSEAGQGALLLIMDASGSMTKTDAEGNTLMDGAKQALRDVVQGLPEGMHTGLRVYGHRVPNTDKQRGCKDTELIQPVGPLDRQAMLTAIDGFQAKGFTPIGHSLQKGADDLPPEGARSIILVSDGEDTCAPPNPCKVAATLREDGVDLVIDTVGFALGDNDKARRQLECIAERGGGEFHDVSNAAELVDALQQVSDREARRFDASGQTLEGAPAPNDAQTGQLDTAYTDTVLRSETNWYRFEVPPGTEVQGQLTIAPNPESGGGAFCPYIYLADAGDSHPAYGSGDGNPSTEAIIAQTDPAVIDANEIYLKIQTDNCLTSLEDPATYEIELQLNTVG
jgi:von Willebrand factor type A domain